MCNANRDAPHCILTKFLQQGYTYIYCYDYESRFRLALFNTTEKTKGREKAMTLVGQSLFGVTEYVFSHEELDVLSSPAHCALLVSSFPECEDIEATIFRVDVYKMLREEYGKAKMDSNRKEMLSQLAARQPLKILSWYIAEISNDKYLKEAAQYTLLRLNQNDEAEESS